ncbi:MAG: VWA domain-containing protein [Ignavibacteriales bacterium]|nr:MAG: VWA domain-containing protein [Ignavibacteriaceae bacterium]MBW7872002.1 VWA domain-containing protein [Ignavibacteria bacterium]MCZ2144098.1 VWA domain-containing protein [Ignavibacteriales bacterium]MBV6446102.1 hypothetical protein [Ignavibacteriaceae bacterium]MBZ0197384.1 VWA domain-containing protein [Ignavibacteriaceae bacterium]
MKHLILLFLFLFATAYPGGIMVTNPQKGTTMHIASINTETTIENQVSITKVTTLYLNNTDSTVTPTLIYNLPGEASAVKLRWKLNDIWYEAGFSANPQDTTMGGGGSINYYVAQFLRQPVVIYPFTDSIISEKSITVEFTYVEFLPYDLGVVGIKIPHNLLYSNFSNPNITSDFTIKLISHRTVNSFTSSSHPNAVVTVSGDTSVLTAENIVGVPIDFIGSYELASDSTGFSSYSTFLEDSASVADTIDGGYFLTVIEPYKDTSNVLPKKIVLVIDRSGSMDGSRMNMAKTAARFIVERLNTNDLFNLVSFSTDVRSFKAELVPATAQSISAALVWINNLNASGGTDASLAFATAIPNFYGSTDSTANMIMFITDGEANTGIWQTGPLLNYINTMASQINANFSIFTFGIGANSGVQLLQLIANQYSGRFQLIQDADIVNVLTKFYLKIQNPVLLSPVISFSNPGITSTHPTLLPNFYIGEQFILSGRYMERITEPVTIQLSGKRFGQNVTYQYQFTPNDSADDSRRFLTKVWAKQYITDLFAIYYTLNPNSAQALEIKQSIIALSLRYGIITAFTSFGFPTDMENEEEKDKNSLPDQFVLYPSYPNPFNPSTTIKYSVPTRAMVKITVYDMLGRIIEVLTDEEKEPGTYSIQWNASKFSSGMYILTVEYAGKIYTQKLLLIK